MAEKKYLDEDGAKYFWDKIWGKIKTALAGKQDAMTAGNGISIANNTISAKEAIMTANNLAPESDTPTGWRDLLRSSAAGVDKMKGYFLTFYNTNGVFTNQPAKVGFLETFRESDDIYQRWKTLASGVVMYRSGNSSGWSDPNSDGQFRPLSTGNQGTYFGTCSTGASEAAKVVTISGFKLETGVRVSIKFSNANNYNGTSTLNVNGTGAKDIAYIGTNKTTRYTWTAGEVVDFVYDGSNYVMVDGGVATTTYYGVTKLTSGATSTSGSTALTPGSLNSLSQNMISGAPVYSASSTYAVGDRVRYGYYTYECTTAITTAEAWNAAHWKALDPLQTQIDAIKAGTKQHSSWGAYHEL